MHTGECKAREKCIDCGDVGSRPTRGSRCIVPVRSIGCVGYRRFLIFNIRICPEWYRPRLLTGEPARECRFESCDACQCPARLSVGQVVFVHLSGVRLAGGMPISSNPISVEVPFSWQSVCIASRMSPARSRLLPPNLFRNWRRCSV